MRISSVCLFVVVLLSGPARAVEFNMSVKADGVRLGAPVLKSVSTEDFKGRVVLLDFWGINSPLCATILPKLAALNSELAPFNLLIVGSHQQNGTPEQIKSKALKLGVNFPVVQLAGVEGGNDFTTIPHCMLFDHTGKCIYRGLPGGVEMKMRQALGAALADTGSKTLAAPVAGLARSLRKGVSPARVLRQAVGLLKDPNKAVAADARTLVARLTAVGQAKLDEAKKITEDNPLKAYDLAQKVVDHYKGTPVAVKAGEVLALLKNDPAVALEVKARPTLEAIRKLDQILTARATAAKVAPDSPGFLRANRANINQLQTRLNQIKKKAPEAKATAEAVQIAGKYGITPK